MGVQQRCEATALTDPVVDFATLFECRRCGQMCPEFERAKLGPKRVNWCRPCRNAYNRAWKKAHPQVGRRYESSREQRRRWKYKSRYGITPEEYDHLLSEQGGVCLVCGEPERAATTRKDGTPVLLCVDHDHVTGEVRGLLCRTCNLMIGHARDRPELLATAERYLRG